MTKRVKAVPYSDERIDAILEAFLAKCPVAKWRHWPAIRRLLYGLAANNSGHHKVTRYTPRDRLDRTGEPLNSRDLWVIRQATSTGGRHNKAYLPKYIAKILGRSEQEVDRWMRARATAGTGFFTTPSDVEVADIVHKILKKK